MRGELPAHDGAHHGSRTQSCVLRGARLQVHPRHGHLRNDELEATNYFFSIGDQENVLELTYNHDGRMYDLGTGYGHVAIGVDDLDRTLAQLETEHGIAPERPPYQVSDGGSRICFVRDPDGSLTIVN